MNEHEFDKFVEYVKVEPLGANVHDSWLGWHANMNAADLDELISRLGAMPRTGVGFSLPTPPKFRTVEEADAWMEAHYGE